VNDWAVSLCFLDAHKVRQFGQILRQARGTGVPPVKARLQSCRVPLQRSGGSLARGERSLRTPGTGATSGPAPAGAGGVKISWRMYKLPGTGVSPVNDWAVSLSIASDPHTAQAIRCARPVWSSGFSQPRSVQPEG